MRVARCFRSGRVCVIAWCVHSIIMGDIFKRHQWWREKSGLKFLFISHYTFVIVHYCMLACFWGYQTLNRVELNVILMLVRCNIWFQRRNAVFEFRGRIGIPNRYLIMLTLFFELVFQILSLKSRDERLNYKSD